MFLPSGRKAEGTGKPRSGRRAELPMVFKSLVAVEMTLVVRPQSDTEQCSKVGKDRRVGWGSETCGCLFSLENIYTHEFG